MRQILKFLRQCVDPHRGARQSILARWVFLRALALIYFSAFYALLFQIKGLNGPQGILPTGTFLRAVAQYYGSTRLWHAPTLFWISSSSTAMMAVMWIGIAASVVAFLNVWPRLSFFVCFVCFLSFVTAAQDFSGYQSDGMLLEAGFISLFFAPGGLWPGFAAADPPSRASLWLLRWEWFRIYFESGLVKLLSGDPQWRNLTAMDDYYQNSPLPSWIGWYVQHLPHWFHAVTVVLTLGMASTGCRGRNGRPIRFNISAVVAYPTHDSRIPETTTAPARALRDRISGLERWAELGAVPLHAQTAAPERAAGHLRAVPAALRLESVVRVAWRLATERHGAHHRGEAARKRSRRDRTFPQRSLQRQAAKTGAGGTLAVLGYEHGGEAADRQLVEAAIPGVVCARAGAHAGWTLFDQRAAGRAPGARLMAGGRGAIARANVIGAGPNGLAAAVELARAGLAVEVFEAEAQPGGAARTMELTLPGFHHDFGSSVYPMGAGSPFFRTLPLADLGLEWVHGDACAAHPLDDGTAVTLERMLKDQARELDEDGRAWNELVRPAAERWWEFAEDALRPPLHIPAHPLLMARFGVHAVQPADRLVRRFRGERAKALFAGLAAHSLLALDQPMSAAVGLIFAASAPAVGWPVAGGGAQAIPNALIRRLEQLGGAVHTSRRIRSLDELDTRGAITLCDVSARQLLSIAGSRLAPSYRRALERFRFGPGAFKIDYALSAPIPWKAAACHRAMTVHVGGTFAEIAEAEQAVSGGRQAERPFVLVAQPSLFDRSRAPAGKHTAWAYCHVPHGAAQDRTQAIEDQIERFAPGFRDCVLARRAWSPDDLEASDANLVGGDVNAGAFNLKQVIFRPSLRAYRTGTPGLYLCSASTPPGGGVHGMCGYNAARAALRDFGIS